MIYLVTGVPGSFKSCYTVGQLIPELIAQVPDGFTGTRRLCVDGIPDLQLDHFPMCPCTEVRESVRESTVTVEGGHGIANWYEWAKPGDLIVVDEVQRYFRARAMGVKVPRYITELETHRHYGIDIVLVTQKPRLIDSNVRDLVGQHHHMRRIFGFNSALRYTWDGCQTETSRVAQATKSPYFPKKSHYDLYKSSVLHIKQKKSVPPWVFVPIIAISAGAFVLPKALATLSGATKGEGVTQKPVAPVHAAAPVPAPQASGARPVSTAAVTPSVQAPDKGKPGSFQLQRANCISTPSRCSCFDNDGNKVPPDPDLCRPPSSPQLPSRALDAEVRPAPRTPSALDLAMFSDIAKMRPSHSFD